MNPTLTAVEPFPSHASLRAGHLELLKTFHESGEASSYAPLIREFIQRGVASGLYLDRDADREGAQSILDYWGTRLYRLTTEETPNTLLDFDVSQAPDLEGATCPYVGLNAFGEKDSANFFGRQRLVAGLVDRLQADRILIVVGSSGSGKSSLVRAGLLPALKTSAFSGDSWVYPPVVLPGAHPMESLTAALQGTDGRDLVLVVDQFEETFTLCLDEAERQAFAQKLLELARDPARRHRLIITLRMDFVTQMVRLPDLNQEQYYFHIPPLDARELREAILTPAERIGLRFEDRVVDSLLNDILGEPAALPMLQFTLLRLWESRERNRISWAAYTKGGRGRKVIEVSANEFYEGLIPEQQQVARQILLRLVRPAEGMELTSYRVRRDELYARGYASDRIDAVLQKFEAAHLLRITPGEQPGADLVEVAHEALIRNWSKLEEWLVGERERLRDRRRLTGLANLRHTRGEDPAALLRGSLLAEARAYDDLNEVEARFVADSLSVEQAEEAAREAARLREIEQAKRIAKIARSGAISAIAVGAAIFGSIPIALDKGDGGGALIGILLWLAAGLVMVIMSLRIGWLSLANAFGGHMPLPAQPVPAPTAAPAAGPHPLAAPAVEEDAPKTWKSLIQAGISYIFVPLPLFTLLFRRKRSSRFTRFHAIQAIVVYLLTTLVSASFSGLDASFSVLLSLALYGFMIYFAVQALRGRYPRLWLAGNRILKFLDRKKKGRADAGGSQTPA